MASSQLPLEEQQALLHVQKLLPLQQQPLIMGIIWELPPAPPPAAVLARGQWLHETHLYSD